MGTGVTGTKVRQARSSIRFYNFCLILSGWPVTFRLVVFRPFITELILAKVTSSEPERIRRTYVSPHALHLA